MFTCNRCGCEKEESERANKALRRCRPCHNAAYKEWREKNPDKHAARTRGWRGKNKDKVRDSNRRHREKNPELQAKDLERITAWVKANPNAQKRVCAEHYQKNKSAYFARSAARRTQTRIGNLLPQHRRWVLAIYETARDLGLEVDHVVPVKGKTVSGLHVPWNLQLLAPEVNKTKGNKLREVA